MTSDPLYRAPTRTRVEPVDLLTAFGRAFVELADRRADTHDARNLVELVARQARHEMADDATTPEDDDVAYNWNLTGLKREAGYPWTTLGTHELVADAEADRLERLGLAEPEHHPHGAPAGKRAIYFKNLGELKSHPATHFRAFGSLDEAAWWSLRKYLAPGQRYATPAAQAALFAGDAQAFATELKRLGYYTSTLAQYAKALDNQRSKVERDAARVDWAGLPVVSQATAKELTESGALALGAGVRASQQWTLADLERARREREGNGET